MKYLSILLGAVCIALAVSLVVVQRNDLGQHENDLGEIAGFSNQVVSAREQIDSRDGSILVLSNSLDESHSMALAFSNQLTEAKSTMALSVERITHLNGQVAEAEAENQTLGHRVMGLTNQLAGLTSQIAIAGTNLDQANKEYALLGNRLRRDVAERTVLERKFNNLSELQIQMQKLKQNNSTSLISSESLFSGLDVEIKSNGAVHVIAPD